MKDNIMKQIFITINPHYKDCSIERIIDNFNYALKTYYRKKLGHRYNKHQEKQYPLALAPEKTKNFYSEPHIHVIVKDIPENDIPSFSNHIKQTLWSIYPQMTFGCQTIRPTEIDSQRVWSYILKEDRGLFTSQDLREKSYKNYSFDNNYNQIKFLLTMSYKKLYSTLRACPSFGCL